MYNSVKEKNPTNHFSAGNGMEVRPTSISEDALDDLEKATSVLTETCFQVINRLLPVLAPSEAEEYSPGECNSVPRQTRGMIVTRIINRTEEIRGIQMHLRDVLDRLEI